MFHFLNGIVQFETGAENDAVCSFQPLFHFGAYIISGKADTVQAYNAGRVSVDDDEGAYVLYDLGHAANHGTGADSYELVDTAHTADDCMVFHGDVAGSSGKAGHDDMIAEVAVVCDVGIGLKHVK